jgi:MoaA/NifB/PqqE/SkfB family radical SAM enzyme
MELPLAGAGGGQFDSFCAYAWTHLEITGEGNVRPCCLYQDGVLKKKDGSPIQVAESSLDEVWNSDDMRELRRAMVQGEWVSGCEECYKTDQVGGNSMRKGVNQRWHKDNKGKMTVERLKAQARAEGFRSSSPPGSIDFVVGNLCNLKCRMCHSWASSRVALDRTHRMWTADHWAPNHDKDVGPERLPGVIRPGYMDFVRNELLPHARHVRELLFQGGETLLIKEVEEVLQWFVDAGAAQNIVVWAQTNATTTRVPWLRLAEKFESVRLGPSIDGVGKHYEYIRYPAKWDVLVKNLKALRRLPHVGVDSPNVTLQNYNILNIVELFRYLDSIGLSFTASFLKFPRYLSIEAMPPRARRLAAERLRAYAGKGCQRENRAQVLGFASTLESLGEQFDDKLMRDFMLFTNDLDASRGQSFRETCPELLELIAEAGFTWTDETLHARAPGSKQAVGAVSAPAP